MELQVVGAKKPLSVSDTIFGREYSEGLVHQVVVAYRNAGRAGTKAQKSRSDMSGTTKKFKKQKGGGARHGDYRAPIFVGGGRAFAARPRDFAQKVNKKMYRGAIQAILSQLNREGRLQIVDSFGVDKVSTKALAAKLKDPSGRTLIVTENVEQNLFLSARNLHRVAVVD
ncbi:MAG: 50S ribosomal protein L4, partial [Pseudolabrys sp.]